MRKIRSEKTKQDFIKYPEEHPDERFWQAVRNFAGVGFVFVGEDIDGEDASDTFYWEEL